MGAAANFPIALAAGLGLNGMIAGFVQIPGMTWADGMGIVVLEGIVIVLLVLTGLREAIFRAVPKFLRSAISVGIGLLLPSLAWSTRVSCDQVRALLFRLLLITRFLHGPLSSLSLLC